MTHPHDPERPRPGRPGGEPPEVSQDPPAEDEATPEQPVVQRAGVPLVDPDHDPDDAAEDASPDQSSAG